MFFVVLFVKRSWWRFPPMFPLQSIKKVFLFFFYFLLNDLWPFHPGSAREICPHAGSLAAWANQEATKHYYFSLLLCWDVRIQPSISPLFNSLTRCIHLFAPLLSTPCLFYISSLPLSFRLISFSNFCLATISISPSLRNYPSIYPFLESPRGESSIMKSQQALLCWLKLSERN